MEQINAVPVFKTGEWNGDSYSVADLHHMADAASSAGYEIPLKLGHKNDDSAPAAGWVENVRVASQSLLADFVAIPKTVYDLIAARAYAAVSCEIFWDLKRNGRTFPRALKAVALLGAGVPAVSGLKPLYQCLSLDADAARVVSHEIDLRVLSTGAIPNTPSKPETAWAEDRLGNRVPNPRFRGRWEEIARTLADYAQDLAGPNAPLQELRAAQERVRRQYPELQTRVHLKMPADDV